MRNIIRETFRGWREDKAPRLAAALAYYTVFSIAPLLVLIISIASMVVGNSDLLRGQVLAETRRLVGAQGAEMVGELIENASRPRDGILAGLAGLVGLVAGATGVFLQLKDALNTIWEVAPKAGRGVGDVLKERLGGLVLILGLGFLLLASLVISTALSVLTGYFRSLLGGAGAVSLLLNYTIQLVVITFLFGALFHRLPDVKLGWRDVIGGAFVTALLFLIGQYLLSLYFTYASPASAYGAAGSFVVLLLWLYYTAQIFLLGAEFTKARYKARHAVIVQAETARPLTSGERAQQGIPKEPEG